LKSKSKSKPKILGIIPARGGSKGIKNKNIQNLRGRPLVGWAVKACKNSEMLDKFFVSTDDDAVVRIAQTYGAEIIPRPKTISGDKSRDIEFLKHALRYVGQDHFYPDIIAWFPPDCPIRSSEEIDDVLRYMVKKDLDSIRTAIYPVAHPMKMWIKRGDGRLTCIGSPGMPRQELPTAYLPFGMVNATKVVLVNVGELWGKKLEFYMVDPGKYLDIDTPEQLEKAQTKVREFGIK